MASRRASSFRAVIPSHTNSAGRSLASTEDGFTLVELLILMFVGLLVIGGTLKSLNKHREISRTEKLRVEVQQNARYALDMLIRDLMEAGQGMDPNPVFGVVAASDGGIGKSDTLYIIYADAGAPVHALLKPPAGKEKSVVMARITCADAVTAVQDGDLIYMASGSARGVARVDQVVRNPNGNACAGDPNLNLGTVKLDVSAIDGERHGWVLQGNEEGAALEKVNAAVYFVDTSDPSGPKLARATEYDGGWVPVPIADMISSFETDLIFVSGTVGAVADGADADPDNDYDDINTIKVALRALARRTDKDLAGGTVFGRSYAVSVTPRNPLYTRNR